MGYFVRGETNTIIGTVNKDLSSASNIEMWINTFGETFVHDKGDLTFVSIADGKTNVGYKLSQEESLSCSEDYISVQVRWIMADGSVGATKRKLMAVDSADWDSATSTTIGTNTTGSYDITGSYGRITEEEITVMINQEG